MSKQTPPNENTRRERRVPLDAQVELKFENFQGFLDEIAANISLGGMFVKGTNPPPVGTVVRFALKLQDDYALIQGTGEVAWVRARDAGPEAPAGVGIRFLKLREPSGELVRKIVERYENEGGETFDLERGEPIAPSTPEAHLEPGSLPDVTSAMAAETDAGPASDPDLDPVDLHIDEPPEERPPLEMTIFTPPDPGLAAPEAAAPPAADSAPTPAVPPVAPVAAAPSALTTPGAPARPLTGDKPPPPRRRSGLGKGGRRPSFLLLALLVLSALLGAAGYRFTEMLVEWGTGYASEAEEASRVRDIPPLQSLQGSPAQESPGPPTAATQEATEEPVVPTPESAAEEPGTEPPPPSSPPAAADSMTQVRLITWKTGPDGDGTLITLRGNGRFHPENLTQARLPSRLVLKLRAIDWPLRDPVLEVGTAEVRRIRTGFHPKPTGNELHIVFDLADDDVQLAEMQIGETDIHLFLRR